MQYKQYGHRVPVQEGGSAYFLDANVLKIGVGSVEEVKMGWETDSV